MTQTAERFAVLGEGAGRASFEITQILAASFVEMEAASPATAAAWSLEVGSTLEKTIPVIDALIADMQTLEVDMLDAVFDDVAQLGSDLADLHMALLHAAFEPQNEAMRLLLLRLVQLPLFGLLHFLHEMILLHLDPWVVCDNPEKPDMQFSLNFSSEDGKKTVAALKEKFGSVIPHSFFSLTSII